MEIYGVGWILEHDDDYKYKLLGRMLEDCHYFLGNGMGNERHLWGLNVEEHIKYMKAIWKSFPKDQKPKYLKWKQILELEKMMKEIK